MRATEQGSGAEPHSRSIRQRVAPGPPPSRKPQHQHNQNLSEQMRGGNSMAGDAGDGDKGIRILYVL